MNHYSTSKLKPEAQLHTPIINKALDRHDVPLIYEQLHHHHPDQTNGAKHDSPILRSLS